MRYSNEYWEDVEKVITCIPNIEILFGKKIFITGATGMICSSIAEILFWLNEKKGAKIKIFLAGRDKERMRTRFSAAIGKSEYTFVQYDATENYDMHIGADADYIIHGASNANPYIYVQQPVETMIGNVVGLNVLLKMAASGKTKRLLYISSSEVYGNKKNNREFTETDYGFVDILNPRACYPNAKRASETLCISYGVEYDIDTVIVRPGHIYGPTITRNDSRATAQFTWNVLDGKDILMKSAGTQIRSYCYTMDCASAILAVLLNGEKGNAYNIANRNSNVSIRDMAELIADISGRKICFENPSDIEKKGYNLMLNSSLNSEKLEQLGWNACFDLKDGVMRTIKYLKSNINDN